MGPGRTRRANCGWLERRDERRREVLRKTTSARKTMPSTVGHPNQWRERIWLPEHAAKSLIMDIVRQNSRPFSLLRGRLRVLCFEFTIGSPLADFRTPLSILLCSVREELAAMVKSGMNRDAFRYGKTDSQWRHPYRQPPPRERYRVMTLVTSSRRIWTRRSWASSNWRSESRYSR